MDVGPANPTLNRNHVHPTRSAVAAVAQRAIAHILGTLDDKIAEPADEQTLETMARAQFKSWFDFDQSVPGRRPDRVAPARRRPFPDSFEDSELGRFEGVGSSSAGELIDTVTGDPTRAGTGRIGYGASHAKSLPAVVATARRSQVFRWDLQGGADRQTRELVIACTDVTQAAEAARRRSRYG